MEKPMSMSIKDWLIKKMALKLVVSEKIIESVIRHQFDSANDALNLNNSVEISGFGKFVFNIKKAQYFVKELILSKEKMESSLLEEELSPAKEITAKKRIDSANSEIKYLNIKINKNEFETNQGRRW